MLDLDRTYLESENTLTAYFLVTHGSSDRRSWQNLQNLVDRSQAEVDFLVGGGCLEGMASSLEEQLKVFGEIAKAKGYTEIVVVPLFLLAGVHVKEDLPNAVSIAQSYFSDPLDLPINFQIAAHLGTHAKIPELMRQQFELYPSSQSRILLSHGSRRASANQPIQDLAKSLGAIDAYWSVSPSLETQLDSLITQGVTRITVLPYFLSDGYITESIEQKISSYIKLNETLKINLTPVPIPPAQIAKMATELPFV